MFTTRPEIKGTFGVVTTTHWLGSAAGMAMLEMGGNAFDAAAAAAFVLQVVEPHLVGPAGDAPIVFHSARTGKTEIICGQAPAPAGATIAHYRNEGLELIPGNGLLATVIPGSFDAWMLLLRDHGSLRLKDVLAPAIHYALNGHPILPRVANAIAELKPFFETEWPTSAALWLPNGSAPVADTLFRNEPLAKTWQRILREAEADGRSREAEIEAARASYGSGFVAEAIGRFAASNEVMDQSGQRHRGVITAADMAGWQATYEEPVSYEYGRYTVKKIGPWGQGPMFLQTLALLKGFDLTAMGPASADFVHTVTEAMKLAFADERRALIGASASRELRPGRIPGFDDQVERTLKQVAWAASRGITGVSNEPTNAEMRDAQQASARKGDTTHIDVIDRDGNMVAAMPSGGWLQSSPIIPELGFALNSRAQMFWLEPGLAASLAPGKRPRTTLTPSFAERDGKPYMVWGSPGGDQQEQWALMFFLRHVHHGLNLQEAIEQPMSHTAHLVSSFYPRAIVPGSLLAEETFGPEVLADLKSRGHDVEVAPEWTVGRLVAASNAGDGILRAAATPRLMQAYVAGR